MKGLGVHLALDFYGCDPETLENVELMKEALIRAVKESEMKVVNIVSYKFSPQGFTGVALLAESHVSIHTWPEYGYVAVDIFTCGNSSNPWKAASIIKEAVKPRAMTILEMKRGFV